MVVDRLQDVVFQLLLFVHAATGYAIPGDRPELAVVPQPYLERAACDRPCRIYGWYPYGRTVYLATPLDPVTDLRARGILLHELVHYVQHTSHAFEEGDPCRDGQRREFEAYRVQARWLFEHGLPGPLALRAGPPPWSMGCASAGPAPAAGGN